MTQVNSYISNSNKKGVFRFFKALVILFLAIFLTNQVLSFFLVDDVRSYTRRTLHGIRQEGDVEKVFVGSSHVYRSLVPSIADEIFGAKTYNLGTSLQNLDGSFMMIKEAAKYNDIKDVYLELYFDIVKIEYKNRVSMTETYIIADYLNFSVDKLRYLLEASTKKHYINSVFPVRRNWKKNLNPRVVLNTVRGKLSSDYRTFAPDRDFKNQERYVDRGYVETKKVVKDGKFELPDTIRPIRQKQLSSDNEKNLKRIIDFCKSEGIRLHLFSAPVPPIVLEKVGNYDSYIVQISKLASENSLEYRDFNLLKPSYFSFDSELFSDDDHLSSEGAKKFTEVFAKYYSGKLSDDIFYKTWSEKIGKSFYSNN